ncbi:hypothetical protein HYI18_03450 [Clostridium botulinum]|nr:hypothetical protein [Clostridium botulinum]MBD5637670.1 hypothetical protein [Clostridium botulinum]
MRVNKIIEIDKCYEERIRIEAKIKKENDNNEEISFAEILKKNIYKNRA